MLLLNKVHNISSKNGSKKSQQMDMKDPKNLLIRKIIFEVVKSISWQVDTLPKNLTLLETLFFQAQLSLLFKI